MDNKEVSILSPADKKIIELLTEIRDSLKKPEPKKRSKAFEPPGLSDLTDYFRKKGRPDLAVDFYNLFCL